MRPDFCSSSRCDNGRIAGLCNCCRNAEEGRSGKPDGEIISVAFLSTEVSGSTVLIYFSRDYYSAISRMRSMADALQDTL